MYIYVYTRTILLTSVYCARVCNMYDNIYIYTTAHGRHTGRNILSRQ